jgi:hypothetical protein
MSSIPQNLVQCTFDFDALKDDQLSSDVAKPATIEATMQKQRYCPMCKQWLAIDLFGKWSSAKDGLQLYCKLCLRIRAATAYARKREQGRCIKCQAPASDGISLCEQCRTRLNKSRKENGSGRTAAKRYMDKLRDEVLTVYGGICVMCGESHPAFLSVDHMNDDGALHRLSTGKGRRFYQWLKKEGFPQEGFQLLCANCNWLKYVSHPSEEKTYHQIWYARLRYETEVSVFAVVSPMLIY